MYTEEQESDEEQIEEAASGQNQMQGSCAQNTLPACAPADSPTAARPLASNAFPSEAADCLSGKLLGGASLISCLPLDCVCLRHLERLTATRHTCIDACTCLESLRAPACVRDLLQIYFAYLRRVLGQAKEKRDTTALESVSLSSPDASSGLQTHTPMESFEETQRLCWCL